MISERDTHGYIGGSDANKLFGSYETATFKAWWTERLTGLKLNEFSTLDTSVGNIMEAWILDEVGVSENFRSVFMKKEGTIAGINTDALDDGCYHEVKTAGPETVFNWLSGKAISVAYRRQVMHGLYVTGRNLGKLHVLPMTKAEKRNPFLMDIRGKVKTFEFRAEDFDMDDYHRRIMYLTKCFNEKVQPTDKDFQQFIL